MRRLGVLVITHRGKRRGMLKRVQISEINDIPGGYRIVRTAKLLLARKTNPQTCLRRQVDGLIKGNFIGKECVAKDKRKRTPMAR
jgi:hypothetical protein